MNEEEELTDYEDSEVYKTEEPLATTTTVDPLAHLINPNSCKNGISTTIEDLLNNLASGWKYHVTNTDGVKEAWLKLEGATKKICAEMTGWNKLKSEK